MPSSLPRTTGISPPGTTFGASGYAIDALQLYAGGQDAHVLLDQADRAPYGARQAGRDRVVML